MKTTLVEILMIIIAIVLSIAGIGILMLVDKIVGIVLCVTAVVAWISAALICPKRKYFI